jgi:hypothetical protein
VVVSSDAIGILPIKAFFFVITFLQAAWRWESGPEGEEYEAFNTIMPDGCFLRILSTSPDIHIGL